MKNNNEKELKPRRYERLQGAEWDKVKSNYKLLYTYTSDKGNIKGIYQEINGKSRVAHWLNEDEKKEYLESVAKATKEVIK